MDKEDPYLHENLLRYGKVAGLVAGATARYAGEKYLGVKSGRNSHAVGIMQAMAGLRGPVMKIGQILATIPEAIPAEYANELQKLQSDAPPMGQAFVKRRMKTELGSDWESKFSSFDRNAFAAASLGQVHKAVSLEGYDLACKLQYPDMASVVNSDLAQLKFIVSLFEKHDGTFDTKNAIEELSARFAEELDYKTERRNCKIFAKILGEYDFVHVPDTYDEISTDRLLSCEFMEGIGFSEFLKKASKEQINIVSEHLFKSWYIPFYGYGVIHGDPHPGNYSFTENNTINLMDFGCIRIFEAKFVKGVIDLYNSLRTNDRELAVHAYETWGFTELTKEQIEILNMWAGFLYDPLLDDRKRVIGEATGGIYGRETAIQVYNKLKQSGTVTIPREFVFMDRAALGLGSVFIRMQSELNWHNLFLEVIEKFDERTTDKNQKELQQVTI